jgi:hypothetical protein
MYLSESARAASAEEARFRIDRPIAPARAARVVALDPGAAATIRRVATGPWVTARFYVCEAGTDDGGPADDVLLRGIDGPAVRLSESLSGVDVAVLVATDDSGHAFAAAIGRACSAAAITTAGVVIGDGTAAEEAVAALRPHARVLLPSADESDLSELLGALRV